MRYPSDLTTPIRLTLGRDVAAAVRDSMARRRAQAGRSELPDRDGAPSRRFVAAETERWARPAAETQIRAD